VAVGINRDLFFGPELAHYREAKSEFSTVFEVSRNLGGYSRDVHG
jgi:hypothetical protein